MNNFFRESDHLYMAYGVWAVAGLMVLFAGTEMTGAVKDLMRQSKEAAVAAQSLVKVELNTTPLTEADYQVGAKAIATLYPTLKVAGSKAGIAITGEDEGDYQDWMSAIQSTVFTQDQALWEMSAACAGKACSGGFFKANLVGVRQSLRAIEQK